jgi:hypothetical protein
MEVAKMDLKSEPVKRQVGIVGFSLALAWVIALSYTGSAAAQACGGFCSASRPHTETWRLTATAV